MRGGSFWGGCETSGDNILHLKIHTAKNQLIAASGVIHNSAFPRHTCCVCLHPQQPQRRALVGGNPVQRVQDGTSSPSSPLSWKPACCLVWRWHPCMNCRRISNQLIPTPPIHAQTGALGHLPLRDPFRLARTLQSSRVGVSAHGGYVVRIEAQGQACDAGRASLLGLCKLQRLWPGLLLVWDRG